MSLVKILLDAEDQVKMVKEAQANLLEKSPEKKDLIDEWAQVAEEEIRSAADVVVGEYQAERAQNDIEREDNLSIARNSKERNAEAKKRLIPLEKKLKIHGATSKAEAEEETS